MTSHPISMSALVDYNTDTVRIHGALDVDGALLHPGVIEFVTFLHDNMHLVPELREAWCAHQTKKKLLR
jgi:hypothetical protein